MSSWGPWVNPRYLARHVPSQEHHSQFLVDGDIWHGLIGPAPLDWLDLGTGGAFGLLVGVDRGPELDLLGVQHQLVLLHPRVALLVADRHERPLLTPPLPRLSPPPPPPPPPRPPRTGSTPSFSPLFPSPFLN